MRKLTVTAIAAALAITPAAGIAATGTDGGTETTQREDNDFPWGLLGLAGLAGLLGLKRNDRDHDHHRGTTGTGTGTGTRT